MRRERRKERTQAKACATWGVPGAACGVEGIEIEFRETSTLVIKNHCSEETLAIEEARLARSGNGWFLSREGCRSGSVPIEQ